MQLKFRRKKSPLKLLEKGDIQRIAKKKMLKAAPRCPICQKPILLDNTHEILFNNKPTTVHNICPGTQK
jgi:hypothetical protein